MSIYKGIFPALPCPFDDHLAIDEGELRKLARWLASHKGIGGLVTNAHTGEVAALTAGQRAQVTRIVADELRGKLPVVSGLSCEGIAEAVEQGEMAREAGARALLVMPPHGWLRFGMKQPDSVVEYFTAIGKGSRLHLVVNVYPAWTRASYNAETLAALARLPWVQSMMVGTRDVDKYKLDLQTIKETEPDVSVLSSQDEDLLASLIPGVDGALVGLASMIPQMIIELLAASAGDLSKAQALQARIDPLKDAIYGGGEPTADAHARMKYAMYRAGILKSPNVRPPTRLPDPAQVNVIERALAGAGMLKRAAI